MQVMKDQESMGDPGGPDEKEQKVFIPKRAQSFWKKAFVADEASGNLQLRS